MLYRLTEICVYLALKGAKSAYIALTKCVFAKSPQYSNCSVLRCLYPFLSLTVKKGATGTWLQIKAKKIKRLFVNDDVIVLYIKNK